MSLDPFDGALVTRTQAIHSGLPRVPWLGVVSVRVDLRSDPGFTFTVGGRALPRIALPEGASIIPAAFLLRLGQSVRVMNFREEGRGRDGVIAR